MDESTPSRYNDITEREEDTYDTQGRKRWVIPCLVFLVLMCLIYLIVITPFIQWWCWSKMAFTCDNPLQNDPVWLVNCFYDSASTVGTDRWVYILCQGIVMGILADVILAAALTKGADYFTTKENYKTLGEHEEHRISKMWAFEYIGMYSWFLFLAFVYVPYGGVIQSFFCDNSISHLLCFSAVPPDMFDITKIQVPLTTPSR